MPDYLLEIGTEELPAEFITSALKQWEKRILKQLEEVLLNPKDIKFYGTPRRLAVLIEGLPTEQPNREEEIKGPPAGTAFVEGKATKALEGFVRKQGVSLEEVFVKTTEKGDFVFLKKKIAGRTAKEILPELSKSWITELEGRRFMRWGDGDLRFSRPIRWLLALWDTEILPLELINGSISLKSDRLSYGHRILHPASVVVPAACEYLFTLRSVFVEPDPLLRRQAILAQVEEAANSLEGVAEVSDELLAEVTNLVEYPTAVIGEFETEFLKLPIEVITTVMVNHQRYFPVKKDGQILANFLTISNGDPNKKAIIAQGNARVIRARLADAQFFYQADCDQALESYLPQLETVTFQEELGTMRDKVDRIIDIAQLICGQLELSTEQRSEIESTALLCKADLVTQMVYEFPELQGIMGKTYALVSGESANVAQGIFEHYLPKTAEDSLPESLTGQIVGIADRLDTLVGIVGIGQIPTGSSDPFALRRLANAIINITWSAQLPLNLWQLLNQSVADFLTAHPQRPSPLSILQSFLLQRLESLLQDDLKIDYDLVNAVLGVNNEQDYKIRALENLLDLRERAQFLQHIRNNGQLQQIYETVNRSARLATKGDLKYTVLNPEEVVQTALFEKSSEESFYAALVELVPQTKIAKQTRDYQLLVDGLIKISPRVGAFFDGEDSVLVISDDMAIRNNRLNLLGLLRNHCLVLADFGAIVKG